MNKPLSLEEMAERDMRNAIAMGRMFDQLFSAFEQPKRRPLTLYLRRCGDDAIIAEQFVTTFNGSILRRSEWINEHIAQEFGCREDEVSSIQTEDGDFIGINAEPVAYLETR